MNTCKEFEETILTDFIDGELDLETQNRLIAHLNVCSSCRALAVDVKENCVVPFHSVSREEVPILVWENIKNCVDGKKNISSKLTDFLGKVQGMIFFPQFAPALISFVLVFLVGIIYFQNQPLKQAQEMNQSEDVVYQLGALSALPDTENDDLGTPIEQYFL